MSLCGLRIDDESLVVESVFAVVLSESWALSWPNATNGSATADADGERSIAANAPRAVSL
jgi:hypothetical protein